MEKMEKYELKEAYELARGHPISDRHWRTIYRQLQLDLMLDPVSAARTAGWLRRVAPCTRLSPQIVVLAKDMETAFPLDASMMRQDLWIVIEDRLRVSPSIATLYRWGGELGHTRYDQWLSPEDIRLWLLKLLAWRTKPHGKNNPNYRHYRHSTRNLARGGRTKAA